MKKTLLFFAIIVISNLSAMQQQQLTTGSHKYALLKALVQKNKLIKTVPLKLSNYNKSSLHTSDSSAKKVRSDLLSCWWNNKNDLRNTTEEEIEFPYWNNYSNHKTRNKNKWKRNKKYKWQNYQQVLNKRKFSAKK